MTRDEFLDLYLEKSGTPKAARTPTGIMDGHFIREAVPCDCGFGGCLGWQLVKPEKPNPVKITVTQGQST